MFSAAGMRGGHTYLPPESLYCHRELERQLSRAHLGPGYWSVIGRELLVTTCVTWRALLLVQTRQIPLVRAPGLEPPALVTFLFNLRDSIVQSPLKV